MKTKKTNEEDNNKSAVWSVSVYKRDYLKSEKWSEIKNIWNITPDNYRACKQKLKRINGKYMVSLKKTYFDDKLNRLIEVADDWFETEKINAK